MNPDTNMEAIIDSKERHRKRLANLSVPEKIRIVVELQKRRAPILRMRGQKQIVWQLSEDGKAFTP